MKKLVDNKPKRMIPCWFVFFAVLLLSSCVTVGPDYKKPDVSVPEEWHSQNSECLKINNQKPQVIAAWWEILGDSKLTGLMERAVASNLDLKKATARIREARAKRGVTKAGFFPTIDLTGSGDRYHASENTANGVVTELYDSGFDAAWELDIFGGKRREYEAATATLESIREDQRDILVSLLAEVALNYLDARSCQARLAVMTENLKSQNETLQLTTWLQQAGLTDDLAVQQARSNLETTHAQIPDIRAAFAKAANRISLLLGQPPGTVDDELLTCKHIPDIPDSIVIGVPADILRQRPDIRKAERDLAAQTANVGVATAELYPKFTLSGSIGLEALSIGKLFSSDSRTDSRSAFVSWRIFDAGSIRQNINVQTALQEQSLLTYETTVLSALEEVENALVGFGEEQKRKEFLKAAAQAAGNSAEIARNNYQAGLSDFIAVLDAERSVLTLQDQLAQSEWTVVMDIVRIYKALGGGWNSLGP